MTRNTNGILTLAVFLSLFAPGFRGGSSGAGPLTKVETGVEKPAAPDVSESLKEEGCHIKSSSYQADVLRLVQRSLSTGLQLDADKNLSCPMDDLRIPSISQETV